MVGSDFIDKGLQKASRASVLAKPKIKRTLRKKKATQFAKKTALQKQTIRGGQTKRGTTAAGAAGIADYLAAESAVQPAGDESKKPPLPDYIVPQTQFVSKAPLSPTSRAVSKAPLPDYISPESKVVSKVPLSPTSKAVTKAPLPDYISPESKITKLSLPEASPTSKIPSPAIGDYMITSVTETKPAPVPDYLAAESKVAETKQTAAAGATQSKLPNTTAADAPLEGYMLVSHQNKTTVNQSISPTAQLTLPNLSKDTSDDNKASGQSQFDQTRFEDPSGSDKKTTCQTGAPITRTPEIAAIAAEREKKRRRCIIFSVVTVIVIIIVVVVVVVTIVLTKT